METGRLFLFFAPAGHDTARPKSLFMGFTLLELLVVISVIGILAALLLGAINTAKAKARVAACLSNFKQFGMAFYLYAGDHNDGVLPNQDGQNMPLGLTWVQGWEGLPGPDCTNLSYLQGSLVGPYLGTPGVWRCPSCRNLTVAGITMPRLRTVSLNCFMGSPTNVLAVACYRRLGQITQPSPSDALAFVDERIDTINDGSFAMQWDFDPAQPREWVLRDKPGVVHNGGCILTFADSHAALHRWKDPRTLSAPRDDAIMAGNLDVLWLQQHGTCRTR
jgi:prepilin-type N-terminal cleavage/methylation domain-containing protein